VQANQGERAIFNTKTEALAAAGMALAQRLNERVMSKTIKNDYERLSPAVFARILGEININPTDFCWMHGMRYDRLMRWIEGMEDIPAWLRPVMAAYLVPEALDRAWEEAELATTPRPRKPRPVEEKREHTPPLDEVEIDADNPNGDGENIEWLTPEQHRAKHDRGGYG
jgi:hypothetical protein